MARDQAMGRFKTDYAAIRCGTNRRTVGLTAERQRRHVSGNRRSRTARRTARRALGIMWIASFARRKVGELRGDRLPEDEREQEKRKRMGVLNVNDSAKCGDQYEERFVSVVEDVRSLFNVGAIFRTADGAGMDKIYMCGITGAPPRKEIEKVSLGAENTVNWEWRFGCVSILRDLKERGFQIVALEKTENSRPLTQLLADGKISRPLCLVVGNEVSGVSAEALALSDIVADLPMKGMKESLNVSVAFGIAAYALSEKT